MKKLPHHFLKYAVFALIVIIIVGFTSSYFYSKNRNDSITNKETLKAVIASLALEKEDFEGVIKASDDYIKNYGDDIDVWIHRGMSYYQLNDCANATASLYHAVQMNIASASVSNKDVNDLFTSVLNSKLCTKN